jgi:hypothetical protein
MGGRSFCGTFGVGFATCRRRFSQSAAKSYARTPSVGECRQVLARNRQHDQMSKNPIGINQLQKAAQENQYLARASAPGVTPMMAGCLYL